MLHAQANKSLQKDNRQLNKTKGTSVVAAFAFTGRKTDASLCDRFVVIFHEANGEARRLLLFHSWGSFPEVPTSL